MECAKCGKGSGLCPIRFGLALGITCGLFMMICAWTAWLWGWGSTMVDQHAMMYSGYAATFMGGIIGGLWGLLKGFVFGFVLIIVYNFLCCCKKTCSNCGCDMQKGKK